MTATIRTPDPKSARHSKKRKRSTRFSSMEALGFIESPATVSNSWSISHQTVPKSTTDSSPPVKRGAHERTVADVEPNDTIELLVRRKIRWGLVTTTFFLISALAAGAFWLMERPAVQAESASTALESAAESLRPEIISLSEIVDGLVDQDVDLASIAAQTREVNVRARELFDAAGALPATNTAQRSGAADAATSALDASRLISAAAAYRATVIQILVPPPLETDPELIALDEAVRAFGGWQQRFNEVRSALPTGTMSEVSAELTMIAGNLDSFQSRYVDALRDDDRAEAQSVARELADRLAAAESELRTSLIAVEDRASDLINASLSGIDALLG